MIPRRRTLETEKYLKRCVRMEMKVLFCFVLIFQQCFRILEQPPPPRDKNHLGCLGNVGFSQLHGHRICTRSWYSWSERVDAFGGAVCFVVLSPPRFFFSVHLFSSLFFTCVVGGGVGVDAIAAASFYRQSPPPKFLVDRCRSRERERGGRDRETEEKNRTFQTRKNR